MRKNEISLHKFFGGTEHLRILVRGKIDHGSNWVKPSYSKNTRLMQILIGLPDGAHKISATEKAPLKVNGKCFKN